MQMKQSRNLVFYLILTLVLSALFLAFKFASGPMLASQPEPEALVPSTGPVVRGTLPDEYEQRFRQLEQWLGQTQNTYESRFERLEQRLAQATSPHSEGGANPAVMPHDKKVQQLEQWLGQTQDAYEARFEQLEQRLDQTRASHDTTLQRGELQTVRTIDVPEDRLRKIEDKLAQTTSRLEELSISLNTLTNDSNSVAAANTALRISPPAAVGDRPLASEPPASPQPWLSKTVVPETPTSTAAGRATLDPGTGPAGRQGKWVINLASYVNEKTAARKLESFKRRGVDADMVSARVDGRTIYRVRLAGFETMAAARAISPSVERQLGLEETWIMTNLH